MEIPNWINLMELGIAVILIFHWIGKFPDFIITILGIVLVIDVLIDIVSS